MLESFGTLFAWGDDVLSGTPTYTTVFEVREITVSGGAAVMADATNHSSTSGAYEQIPSGMFEEIEYTLIVNYDPDNATHTSGSGGLKHAQMNKTKAAARLTTNATTLNETTFDAFVKSFTPEIGTGSDGLTAEIIIGVTGPATIA